MGDGRQASSVCACPTRSEPDPPQQQQVADRPNFAEFPSCRNAESFHTDWASYYQTALRRLPSMRARFRHMFERYGDQTQQRLNIYFPDDLTRPAPIVVFFHGGRWTEGHPDFYDHVGYEFVRAGAVFISAGYRIGAAASIGDAIDDGFVALRWVATNAARFQANPQRITLAGHSSGAHIASMASMTDPEPAEQETVNVHGLVCVSAPVDLSTRIACTRHAAEWSPMGRISRAPANTLIAFGEPELNRIGESADYYASQGRLLSSELERSAVHHQVVPLARHDHIATLLAIGSPSSPLFQKARETVFANVSPAPRTSSGARPGQAPAEKDSYGSQ